jgi:O-antigen ligase
MNIGLKFNISSAPPNLMFRLMVMVFWLQNTFFYFALEFMERIPFIGNFSTLVLPVSFILLTITSSSYIFNRIHKEDLLLYFCVFLIILFTLSIYPDSSVYIFPQLGRIFKAVSVFYLGVAFDYNESKKDLFWCSIISVITVFAYQLYVLSTGRVLTEDNMNTAYNTLPSVMYLIFYAFCNKKIKLWIIAMSCVLLFFVFGTRGPLIALFVYLGICAVYYIIKLKNDLLKVFLIITLFIFVFYISSQNRIIMWATSMSEWFSQIGFSSRIFDLIIEEELANSSGRDELIELVINAIADRPFRGYGFMGDRAILGKYCHNIVFEFLCSYGIVFGGFALGLVVVLLINAFNKSKHLNDIRFFFIMFTCMVMIKLLFSGSYVFEPYFYMLLGLSCGIIRRKTFPSN